MYLGQSYAYYVAEGSLELFVFLACTFQVLRL